MKASDLNKPLKILTMGMVFLGVLSIVVTGYLPPPLPLIVMGILALGFFFWESRFHNRIYSAVWYLITLLFLGWCFYDLFVTLLPGEEVVWRVPSVAMQLSIFLQIFKVYNPKSDRDYVQIFLLSFFQFVSSAGVSVEFYLLPLLVVYLVTAMWALTLFHFRRRLQSMEGGEGAYDGVAVTGFPGSGKLLTPGLFAGSLIVSVLVAIVAGLVFIFFPRSATSDNPLNLQSVLGKFGGRYTSGASGEVDLNIAGIFSRNTAPVMRASFPRLEEPPPNVLWRRAAMHQYDGRRHKWNKLTRYVLRQRRFSGRKEGLVNILVPKSPRLFLAASDFDKYNSIEDLRNDPELLEQHFTLLMNFTIAPVCSAFSAPVAAVIADVPVIACDDNESFYFEVPRRGTFSYIVFSRQTDRREGAPGSVTESSDDVYEPMKRFYTGLPSDESPRFRELALDITRDATTDYQKAWSIRNYLATHYRYSLDLTQEPGRKGPLYDFLFEDRPGHCEYFASAMVILLRELEVPSRLAYGYSAGEWHPERKEFEVRQCDAHAWAEVYIRGRGWIPFDPTPTIADDDTPRTFVSILLEPVSGLLSFFERQWAEAVIGYTRFKQSAIVSSIVTVVTGIWEGLKEYVFSVRLALARLWGTISKDMFLGLFVPVASFSVLVALGAAAAVRIRRRTKFRLLYGEHRSRRRSGSRVKFYQKMLRILMDKGIRKEIADTPLEFADRLVSASRPFYGVKTLTDLYYFVRFGNGKLSREQSRTISSMLQRLSRVVPPRRPVRSSQ